MTTPTISTPAPQVSANPTPDGQLIPFAAASISISQNSKGFTLDARRSPAENTDLAMRQTLVELWQLSIMFRALFPSNPNGAPSDDELTAAGLKPVSPMSFEAMVRLATQPRE